MALEQWEIDLRKQLDGTTAVKPKKEDTWEDRLREQMNNIPVAVPVAPKPKNSQIGFFVLLIGILLLALGLVVAQKTGFFAKIFAKRQESADSCPVGGPTEIRPRHENLADQVGQLRIDFDRMKHEDKARYEQMQKKLHKTSDRVTLLGMMQNENLLVGKNQGVNSDQFLYFNDDWTISGMPQYLELTDADLTFLNKYVKK